MTDYIFDAPEVRSIPVLGETREYAVHRIFCVGQNYAAHAAEMGAKADPEAPFYFTKQRHSVVLSEAEIPYPAGTSNFHYEMELAIAVGKPLFRCTKDEAESAIYAYGCALDMTRRDLQAASKERRRPWDTGKDVENSAVFAPMTKSNEFSGVADQRIYLAVNGATKQDGKLSDMIHSCTAILCDLSKYYRLQPGDVVPTGTPSGVGPVVSGDNITGGIDGLTAIELTIGAQE